MPDASELLLNMRSFTLPAVRRRVLRPPRTDAAICFRWRYRKPKPKTMPTA
jgi:hypothetical protein